MKNFISHDYFSWKMAGFKEVLIEHNVEPSHNRKKNTRKIILFCPPLQSVETILFSPAFTFFDDFKFDFSEGVNLIVEQLSLF